MTEKKSLLSSLKGAVSDAQTSINEKREIRIEQREAFLEEHKDNPDKLFKATSKVGNIQVDEVSSLFKVTNAKRESFDKKKSKLGGATMFMLTGGMSSVVGLASKSFTGKGIYRYTDLLAYELLEDDSQVTKGGLGSAVVGGVVFGGVGAIIGGVTGKKKTKKVIESMMIKITVNDIDNPMLVIPFITKSTKVKSKDYKAAHTDAHKMLSMLAVITAKAQQQLSPEVLIQLQQAEAGQTPEVTDPFEEVKKLKELLDMGIISDEEFESKKNDLLKL